jgi:putative SOS response-associated peptidase YedK
LTTSIPLRQPMSHFRPPTTLHLVPPSPLSGRAATLEPASWSACAGALVGFGSSGPDPTRSTFNARSENLTRSDLWRVPLHKRRCLVPISGFFEWRKPDKVPFRFTLRDEPLYALAGLWDAWKNPAGDWLQSFSIITVDASAAMSTIHDRMPAILMPPEYDQWLDRGETERPPTHLLRPYPETTLQIHPANPKVGNVRNQGIDLLDSP